MTLAELATACVRVQRARLGQPVDAPIRPEDVEAMTSVLETAAAYRPGIMAHIEAARGPVVADELRARRSARDLAALRERAAPVIAAVAAEASRVTGGDVTSVLLTGRCAYPWLSPWRDLCWARLADTGLRTRQLSLVFGRDWSAIAYGIKRHRRRMAAGGAMTGGKHVTAHG